MSDKSFSAEDLEYEIRTVAESMDTVQEYIESLEEENKKLLEIIEVQGEALRHMERYCFDAHEQQVAREALQKVKEILNED
jgi:hypothetical protein